MTARIKLRQVPADDSSASVCKGRLASMALHQAPLADRGGVDSSRRAAPVRLLRDEIAPRVRPASETDDERRFRTLIEQAADGIFVTDAQNRIVLANSRMCFLLGYREDEIVGLDVIETYLPEDRAIGRQFLAQLAPGTTFRFERMLMRKDGYAFPIEASVAWLPGGERQTIVRDMTARRRAEEALRLEERRLRAIVRLSELVPASRDAFLDAAVVELRALVGSGFAFVALCSPDCAELTVQAWSQEGVTLGGVRGRTFHLDASGWLGEAVRECKPVVVNETPAVAPDGGIEPVLGGLGADPAGLSVPSPLARLLSIPIRDRGRIVGVAGAGNKATPYTDQDVRQVTQMLDVVWKIAERQHAEDELRALNEELERRVVQRTAEYEAANVQLQGLLQEQEALHAELAYRALHDPLTGLGNRALFAERLDYAFARSNRGVAVLWIDLDHFKQINDIFGHDVGDEVLVAFADKLRDVVRETDDIARMGGDEFAVVLPNVFEADARLVADRVLDALCDPQAFRLKVGASIGVAWQAPGAMNRQTLVRQADVAMYRAKAGGGGVIAA